MSTTPRTAPEQHVVLVTDADQRAALAVVRSLGRAGYRVVTGGPRALTLAGSSRYSREHIILPDPLAHAAPYVDALSAAVARLGVTIVIPISEASTLAALSQRGRFPDCLLPFPDHATFMRACDKADVLRTAADLGIAVPAQGTIACRGAGLPAPVPPFPLVLKPSRSVAGAHGALAKHSVLHVSSRAELDHALATLPESAYPLLLQQRVIGPGAGIFVLVWDGVVRAVFAHRRLREKPPAGGVSVYRESVSATPELVERSRALLERLQWQGVAMVEYKLDTATGTPYLMEINGRFWGSVQLAIDAGVDFPRLLVEAACGMPAAPPPQWKNGVRSRWWWGDVDQLLTLFRRRRATLALPDDHPGRFRTLIDFLRPRMADRNETLRADDPMPFVVETLDWLRGR